MQLSNPPIRPMHRLARVAAQRRSSIWTPAGSRTGQRNRRRRFSGSDRPRHVLPASKARQQAFKNNRISVGFLPQAGLLDTRYFASALPSLSCSPTGTRCTMHTVPVVHLDSSRTTAVMRYTALPARTALCKLRGRADTQPTGGRRIHSTEEPIQQRSSGGAGLTHTAQRRKGADILACAARATTTGSLSETRRPAFQGCRRNLIRCLPLRALERNPSDVRREMRVRSASEQAPTEPAGCQARCVHHRIARKRYQPAPCTPNLHLS
jgi:hypothetical protein